MVRVGTNLTLLISRPQPANAAVCRFWIRLSYDRKPELSSFPYGIHLLFIFKPEVSAIRAGVVDPGGFDQSLGRILFDLLLTPPL